MKTKNMTTLHLRESISRSPLRRGVLLVPLALALFALSPTAPAVSPPPDGGYANDNTAEGNGALFNLTSGHDNTATGNIALLANTTGSLNTATGSFALQKKPTGKTTRASVLERTFKTITATFTTPTVVNRSLHNP